MQLSGIQIIATVTAWSHNQLQLVIVDCFAYLLQYSCFKSSSNLNKFRHSIPYLLDLVG